MSKSVRSLYRKACRLAESGELCEARELYESLLPRVRSPHARALITNDLGAIALLSGDASVARAGFERALKLDEQCRAAQCNLQLIKAEERCIGNADSTHSRRIAVVSFLFNWPSTGGGIIHTAELCQFLEQSGYQVRLFHPRYRPWGIGRTDGNCPVPATVLEFDETQWIAASIRSRFREAVDQFEPDAVIITDSWNFKPHLAAAVNGYRYFLRLQALECLCPLNNLRLLHDGSQFTQCELQQLANPAGCGNCLSTRGSQSGSLHRAERSLSGVGTPEYQDLLLKAFAGAESVLALNQTVADVVRPFARDVRVVTWGMDPERFPQCIDETGLAPKDRPARLLFAGLVREQIKGFEVLLHAGEILWRERRDFEIVVTDQGDELSWPFVRFVGWKSQAELPGWYRQTDVTIVPTIAQEGLSRTAVEAMGLARPVIGSRIGGLPEVIVEGENGLLAEPGNAADLAWKIGYLLDHPEQRARMGLAGRKRFERDFLWPDVIQHQYLPLLGSPHGDGDSGRASSARGQSGASQSTPLPKLGCVLAIRDRAPEVLERTLETYARQTYAPADKVLVDFGSGAQMAEAYQELATEFGWRLFRAEMTAEWNLSAAYNLAVSALDPSIDVVFKGDVDVLLGENVLELAARYGGSSLCIFTCRTTAENDREAANAARCAEWTELERSGRLAPMDGEGIHAYSKAWFERIGGFDLQYREWGYEDSDLRERATWSVGVKYLEEAFVVHQWHPRSSAGSNAQRNRIYYESMKAGRQVVRNEGNLLPPGITIRPVDVSSTGNRCKRVRSPRKVALVTRALNDELRSLSWQLLTGPLAELPRHGLLGTTALGYLHELGRIDADWVINLDEDAFVLNPAAILGLIDYMEQEGQAACGMPDGGVVDIREHNPVVCNACFNIFDLRRVRPIWKDFAVVAKAQHRMAFDGARPNFARRTSYAFDNYEPYYGAFFSLLEAGERILYLDAQDWSDNVSTVILSPAEVPLLIHGWYARLWPADAFTRDRYRNILAYAKSQARMRNAPRGIADALEASLT